MKVWHRWMTPEYASHLARPRPCPHRLPMRAAGRATRAARSRPPPAATHFHITPLDTVGAVERVDAVVIGAGVAGSAAARSMGRRGLSCVLLEQFQVGHARGSSHGPSRLFRLAYPQEDYVRLALRALDSWR